MAARRRRKGWYQRDLAALLDRSEDWMSGVERDIIPVRNVETLGRLARALDLQLDELLGHPQPALIPKPRKPVRRTRATPARPGAGYADFLTPPPEEQPPDGPGPLTALAELLLYGSAPADGPPAAGTAGTAGELAAARREFAAARYAELAHALPGRIAAAQLLPGPAERSALLVAQLHNLAALLCTKLDDDTLAAVTADRALTTARAAGHTLVTAEAQRMVAVAWRRQGRPARAAELAVRAAEELDPGPAAPGTPGADAQARLAAQAELYATAAYSAAKLGDRARAHALIERATACSQAAGAGSGRFGGPGAAVLHQLAVHYELGDAGLALDLARGIDPATLPTAEIRARFFTDVARCFERCGRPAQSLQALLAAERAAPQEVRRSSVRALAPALLRHDPDLPGLREYAARTGAALP
nr:helix-turn-helix transcriptional regulator [Kitasatospora sp. MMS16-BH015]